MSEDDVSEPQLCNGAVTAFGPKLINGYGFTPLQSTALQIPGGFVTCVSIYFFSWLADKYRDSRTLILPLSCVPVIIGAIVVWTSPWHIRAGPLIGYYLIAVGCVSHVPLIAVVWVSLRHPPDHRLFQCRRSHQKVSHKRSHLHRIQRGQYRLVIPLLH